jgi:ATP synthase protein I
VTALKPIKVQAYQIVFWQLMIIVGLAVAVFLIRGTQNGFSALLGGLAYWLPTLVFVWRVFARTSVRAVKRFAMTFFASEAAKLIISAILFLMIVKYLPVTVLPVLIGYIGAIAAFWIVSIFFLSRNQGVSL